ncbi:glutamate racemase [Verrucomicrobiaceae bacterium 5K15]|uniref:Glutamate racemase n=1 Tax=Oceaniferula flava TaxID=2800421 RepID=A0AAE2SAH3_9BACT|nr:glutamate racemase [Oceaniferula flavus]MBK1854506.1 glutamate racemase [Oceaniferula flavus]MBM1135812.1 glutamate racemase [Oceaniferula flavus]
MNSPIGILDSGLGGLSVFNEVQKLMPNESVIYFGDSAWCPYGAREADEIQRRVFKVTDFLLEQGCQLIIIACNSATIAAVEALRAAYPVPFVGMEPGVKPAAAMTQTGTVGVLATEASLAGEKFHRLVTDHSNGVNVITRPCPNFVELVERGELSGTKALGIVEEETLPLLEAGADVLVLGCTHYPFLRPLIEQVAGPDVQILDTGEAVARHVARLMKETVTETSDVLHRIITTGDLDQLKSLFPVLCPEIPLEQVSFSHSHL